jgi:hypothetical protein
MRLGARISGSSSSLATTAADGALLAARGYRCSGSCARRHSGRPRRWSAPAGEPRPAPESPPARRAEIRRTRHGRRRDARRGSTLVSRIPAPPARQFRRETWRLGTGWASVPSAGRHPGSEAIGIVSADRATGAVNGRPYGSSSGRDRRVDPREPAGMEAYLRRGLAEMGRRNPPSMRRYAQAVVSAPAPQSAARAGLRPVCEVSDQVYGGAAETPEGARR